MARRSGSGIARAPGPDTERPLEGVGLRHRALKSAELRYRNSPGSTHTLTQSAGPRHEERRGPTQRAPGPDTERRARLPDTKSAGPRHRAPGPDTKKKSAGARHTVVPVLSSCTTREGKSSRPPEAAVVLALKLYYQRRKIQPPAGDRCSSIKVLLSEKENPAGSFQY